LKRVLLSVKIVNDELARLGHSERLAKGPGYYLFTGGEADDWLTSTIGVRTINSLTLKQWIEEYRRLKAVNKQIMSTAKGGRARKQS
jgi:hypothetical protein